MLNRANPFQEWLQTQAVDLSSVGLAIEICEPATFVQITHFHGPGAREALRSQLTMALPNSPREVLVQGAARVYRLAPESYGFYGFSGPSLQALMAVSPADAAVVDLSHARVRVRVRGPRANELLRLGISVDIDPTHFAPGAFIQTALDHNPVLLEHCEPLVYELVFLRTFAESQLHWLVDAVGAL